MNVTEQSAMLSCYPSAAPTVVAVCGFHLADRISADA